MSLSICFANASRHMIVPLRGPLKVWCVVVVTNSACGTGDGWSPATTSPAMCAISTITTAPASSAISLNALKSIILGYALAPTTIIFGLWVLAKSLTSSISMRWLSLRTP